MPSPLLVITCVLVAAFDLIARRVPNRLMIVVALAQGCLIFLDRSPITVADAAVGALTGFAGLLVFYVMGLMGAGDVKFGALLGLFCGPWLLFTIWVVGSLLAGAHALVVYTINASPALQILSSRCAQFRFWHQLSGYRHGRRGIPYAAYLSFGACFAPFVVIGR